MRAPRRARPGTSRNPTASATNSPPWASCSRIPRTAPRGRSRDDVRADRFFLPLSPWGRGERGCPMSAVANPQFALRPYLPDDVSVLREIFRDSIEGLTEDDYTVAQQEAWASAADDEAAFGKKLGG